MSDVDFIDPVNVLERLSGKFKPNLESKKWTDRKDALQELLTLLENNPKLDPKAQYSEIVDQLKKIVDKDTNINVVAVAVLCLKCIASGLRTKFAPYALAVTPIILEKFKEKKPILRSPLIECIDAIFCTTTLDNLSDDIIAAMGKPNPQIKSHVDKFLSRAFKHYGSATVPKKALKTIMPALLKHTFDPDADVREAAYESVGSIMRATGEKAILPLISDISEDKMKMDKIKEHYQKILEEVGPHGLSQQGVQTADHEASGSSSIQASSTTTAIAEEPDPFDLLDPVDVLSKLPTDFYDLAASKSWTDRKDAYEGLLELLEKNPKLDPNAQYGEIVNLLKSTIQKDSNINVCASAAKCLGGIAAGLRTTFAPHALTVTPVIFEKFKEKKATLRDPLVACLDSVYASTSLEVIQEDITSAMEKTNPQVKTQTDLFLHRAFLKFNNATMPKRTLRVLAPLLVKHTGESDPEVRDASYSALAAAMWCIGEQPLLPLLSDISGDKTKMGKIKEFYEKIVKDVGPPVMVPLTAQQDTMSDGPPSKAPQKAGVPKKPLNQARPMVRNGGNDVVRHPPVKPGIIRSTASNVKKSGVTGVNPVIVKKSNVTGLNSATVKNSGVTGVNSTAVKKSGVTGVNSAVVKKTGVIGVNSAPVKQNQLFPRRSTVPVKTQPSTVNARNAPHSNENAKVLPKMADTRRSIMNTTRIPTAPSRLESSETENGALSSRTESSRIPTAPPRSASGSTKIPLPPPKKS